MNTCKLSCLVLLVLLTANGVLSGADYIVPLLDKPPTVDGKINPHEWRGAVGFDGFITGTAAGAHVNPKRVRGYVAADARAIYVAILSELPAEGKLKQQQQPGSVRVVHDDALEVYVNPTPEAKQKVDYQFLSNILGAAQYIPRPDGDPDHPKNWSAKWPFKNAVHDGWWHFECTVPLESMPMVKKGRSITEGAWGVNLARDWKPQGQWEWSSLTGGYRFKGPTFRFVKDGAPAVQVVTDRSPVVGGFTARLQVHNPSDKAMTVSASMVLGRNLMFDITSRDKLTLEPGATQSIELTAPQEDQSSIFKLAVNVASADGQTTFYSRTTEWKRQDGYRYVGISDTPEQVLPVDFRFAYYPYRNLLRLDADTSALPDKAQLEKLDLVIRDRLEDTVVKTWTIPAPRIDKTGHAVVRLEVPQLQGEGFYELALSASGKGIPEGARRVRRFERKRFPWEHTPTGRSTTVFAPFTPLTVRGTTLGCVMRQVELNGLGLFDQVTAEAQNTGVKKRILAAPATYAVTIDGQSVKPKPTELKIEAAEHQVITRGGFTAGALRASHQTTWDVDGCAKVELTLTGSGGKPLEALDLVIPLSPDQATHIHANADRIRNPVAGRLPEGEGIVWKADACANDEYIRNFCPYIFLGSPNRGLCWFAENDLNWSWDRSTVNLDVSREGGQVVLRVHLVNKPVVIDTPRTLTFGLQPAPVKPRLSPAHRHYWRYRLHRDRYTMLGGSVNWFAAGQTDLYPAGKDFYLWEMLKRGNQQELDWKTINGVIEWGKQYHEHRKGKVWGRTPVDNWVRHCRHNLRSRLGKTMVFYYNRGTYQACTEFEMFKDEWYLSDYRTIEKGDGRGEIKVVPSASYIDCFLYWYARSFEIGGNRGVYWDNMYIRPSFNTEMTDAYTDDDGRIIPASGVWGLRELVKRTFIMENERQMLPITWIHMTSFNWLPVMSFATVQWDWEWKYGRGDVQQRFTRDQILVETTGDHSGAWPGLLGDKAKSATPFMRRTYFGVATVHELDSGVPAGHFPMAEELAAVAEPIYKLLENEKTEVYRYWDERPQPVKAEREDMPCIVYSLPGAQALVLVTGYADDDAEVTMTVDEKVLGLPGAKAVDVETGKPVPRRGGKLVFPLTKHDFKLIKLTK